MRRFFPAAAALALLVASPSARSDDGKPEEGAKPAPAKEAPKKEAPPAEAKPAPAAKDGKSASEAKKPATPAPALTAKSPRSRAEALLMLERVVISVNFDEVPLRDAVNWMGAVTGVNMILGPALVQSGEAELVKVSLRLAKVTARQALELIVDSHRLGVGFQSGVLTVTTKKEARGKPVLKLYPLGDITFPLRDFPGPDMILRSQGEEREPEVESEVKPAFHDADDILRLVKDNTGEGTWEDEGVSGSVLRDGLLVRQYEEVHAEVAKLLALLRAAR